MDSGAIIAIVIWVAIAIVARLNIPVISPIVRWVWNIFFTFAAFIPFCGWMTIFIVAKDEDEKKAKKEIVETGLANDGDIIDDVAGASEREQKEREAYETQKKAEREALEKDLSKRAYEAFGTSNITLNSDGSMVKIENGEYMSVDAFKKATK